VVNTYRRRLLDDLLEADFPGLPAVLLVGPRGCGKTTTALRHARSVIRLDDPAQAQAFALDPDVYLAAQEPPTLIDEWQEVPETMAAIKRAVDTGSGGGRFLIAGSVRARRKGNSWPGTGRVTPIRMYGLTEGEIEGFKDGPSFVEAVFTRQPDASRDDETPDIFNLAARITRGGFPEALLMTERQRARWFSGYFDQLVHRDVAQLAEVRNPDRMAALLTAALATTSSLPSTATLAEAAQIDVRTAAVYLGLLEDLGIIVRLPAWHSNQLKRLVRAPKLHAADTGLAAAALRFDTASLMADGNLLGRFLESFAVMQLMPQAVVAAFPMRVSHLRDTNNKREIDVVLEGPAGAVVGIEIKAGTTVGSGDARHLAWLRDELGPKFRLGVVLHTGRDTFRIADRIWAMPISALWRPW